MMSTVKKRSGWSKSKISSMNSRRADGVGLNQFRFAAQPDIARLSEGFADDRLGLASFSQFGHQLLLQRPMLSTESLSSEAPPNAIKGFPRQPASCP